MSQHHKKDRDTRQRKNVDKEIFSHNDKQQTKSTSLSSSSGTNSSLAAPNSVEKSNNGALTTMNTEEQQIKSLNKQQNQKLKAECEALVLWRQPIKTSKYCFLEIVELVKTLVGKLMQRKTLICILLLLASLIATSSQIPGRHQVIIEFLKNHAWFVLFWTGLGVLSSVGLGTGLHTFLLYLGPHIASVTLAAYECNSLNFPKPPYPVDIICPEEPYAKVIPSIWAIMSKVRFEAFLWGAGTALGELPPYFMARAARLSGYDSDDEDELAELEALNAEENQKNLSLLDRGKLLMKRIVQRVGFFGIMICASIPNPLFDLAGITCGHFLVPFWTFFGATLIGKAVFKMHLQKLFVIIAFNETLIGKALDVLAHLPVVGKKLQEPCKVFLQNQKQRLHRKGNAESGNLLSKLFDTFVFGMICYFVLSILNSLAQNYHKRLYKKKQSTPNTSSTTKASLTLNSSPVE